MKKFIKFSKIDPTFLVTAFLLSVISLVSIYTITYNYEGVILTRNQGFFIIIGFILYFIVGFIDYKTWRTVAFPMYLITIILLVIVSFFGKKVYGATRWIDLGFFQIQPSELLKIFLIILVARFLETRVNRIKIHHLIIIAILAIPPILLVLKQPDLGTTTVILFSLAGILITTRLNWRYIVSILLIVVVSLPLVWSFGLKDFQKQRLVTFLNPTSDPYGSGYNIIQSMIAVGSGGLTGQGLGQGSQSQMNYLPVSHADFIFAGYTEATGFAGAIFLLFLYAILIARIFMLSNFIDDSFAQLIVAGFGAMLLWEVFINIGMNIGIAPVTGIPLPFMSYGGSAVVAKFIMLGILQNIYFKSKEEMFIT